MPFTILNHFLHSLRQFLSTDPLEGMTDFFPEAHEQYQNKCKEVQGKFRNLGRNLFQNKTTTSLIKAWQSTYRFSETEVGKCGLSHEAFNTWLEMDPRSRLARQFMQYKHEAVILFPLTTKHS